MKDRKAAAKWEAAAAAGAAGRRAQRQAIGQASVEKLARRLSEPHHS